VVCTVLPDVAVIVMVLDPAVAVGDTAKVNVDETVPPDAGVSAVGLNDEVIPVAEEAVRATAELKPLIEETVMLADPVSPTFR
jgi:hypothetical protein